MGAYNGWTNYETWAVQLWLSATPEHYDASCGISRAFDSPRERAEALERWVHAELAAADSVSLCRDLLDSSLSHVDWLEITESM